MCHAVIHARTYHVLYSYSPDFPEDSSKEKMFYGSTFEINDLISGRDCFFKVQARSPRAKSPCSDVASCKVP